MAHIEVRNLTYGYSRGTPFEKTALDGVTFSVEKGQLVGVIGHTGSGKSTLMQMLNALLTPDDGAVLLDGEDINRDKTAAKNARFRVGLCFQYPEYQLFEETCAKDIAFGPSNMGLTQEEIKKRVIDAADIVGLDRHLLNRSPFDLSGGQKRRCAIAGVIAMFPEVLILDEPAAGLDPAGRAAVYDMIASYREKTGATVFVVSHNMEEAAVLADKILVMNEGRVKYYGTPHEVFSHARELNEIGLNIPASTRLMLKLSKLFPELDTAVYSNEDASAVLTALLKKEGRL